MSTHVTNPWVDQRLTAGESADLLLRELSLNQNMA
jgi:hypothetical protein